MTTKESFARRISSIGETLIGRAANDNGTSGPTASPPAAQPGERHANDIQSHSARPLDSDAIVTESL